ncbi:hypothetical protein F4780DRAFT_790281 [Xylariomycetidae sp. FL0641]|nr:hypothetical protein F4780DRAFT_790281 [Xylariomycetidae sp. FL0641]
MRAPTLAAELVSVVVLLGCITGILGLPGLRLPLLRRELPRANAPAQHEYDVFADPQPDVGSYNYPTSQSYGGYGYGPPPPPATIEPSTPTTVSLEWFGDYLRYFTNGFIWPTHWVWYDWLVIVWGLGTRCFDPLNCSD